MKFLNSALFILFVAFIAGCSQTYVGVPPNYIGMMLTPTGYENKIYTPGQADVGNAGAGGQANTLVLIQRSGLQVEESFGGRDANADKEDHRCLTGDGLPMTIDVRLLLALPNIETEAGKTDLKRLFLLGNPKAQEGNTRVLVLDAQQVYSDQARQEVRGRIRQLCRQVANFSAAFDSFGAKDDTNLSRRIEKEVGVVLRQKGIPLGIVSVEVSNLKPDQAVIEALVQQAAVKEQQKAIDSMVKFLEEDPARLTVYQIQVNREIAMAATAKGNSVVVYAGGNGGSALPLRIPTGK